MDYFETGFKIGACVGVIFALGISVWFFTYVYRSFYLKLIERLESLEINSGWVWCEKDNSLPRHKTLKE